MPASNGLKAHLITILSTATVTMGISMATIGAGKADKDDVEELQDRDVKQQVINERIDGRLGRLEEGQEELKESIKELPKAIADELRKP